MAILYIMMHNPDDCTYCDEQRELEQKKRELEAIRAFVDRVEKRWKADDNPFSVLRHMREELAAMEKENAGTND